MWLIFSLFFFGCKKIIIESPKQDSSFDIAPWIPVSIWFNTAAGKPSSVSLQLDGKTWEDPYSLLRRRWAGRGGGYDYLAYLDLYTISNGEHVLQLNATLENGKQIERESSFFIERPSSKIEISLKDPEGNPIDGRITIYSKQERFNLRPSYDIDPSDRDSIISTIITQAGYGELYLPTGDYELIIFRSFRDNIIVKNISLQEAETKEINANLFRIFEEEGWSTADFHVHTGASADAFIPNFLRYQSLLASDLDAVVITDHNKIHDIEADLSTLRHDHHHTISIPGNEASFGYYDETDDFRSQAHYNAFPLASSKVATIPPKDPEYPAQVIDNYRSRQVLAPFEDYLDDVALQLNHPRGIQFFPDQEIIAGAHALFNTKGYGFYTSKELTAPQNQWLLKEMPETGTNVLDFDALEIVNRFSWELYTTMRKDWFALLNQGHHITGTGNSDSHALEVEQIGFPANFVPCPTSDGDPENYDMPCLVDAIQEGKLYVSNGPLLALSVENNRQKAFIGERISIQGEGYAVITIKAVDWIPVEEARLIINGKTFKTIALTPEDRDSTGLLNLETRVLLPQMDDFWIILEAGRNPNDALEEDIMENLSEEYGVYSKIMQGQAPIAFTNPIYIDADGDGRWTPPGLY